MASTAAALLLSGTPLEEGLAEWIVDAVLPEVAVREQPVAAAAS